MNYKHGQCTAKSKQTGERCKRGCVPGKKVCKWHGGNSNGAPKGSQNALKHGGYARLLKDTLLDDEKKIFDSIELDPIATLEEQIKLLRIKELRLATKMKETLIADREAGKDDGTGKKKPSTVLLSVSTTQAQDFEGNQSKSITSNSETHSMFYLRLEQAHNTVLDQIRRAMNNLVALKAEQQVKEDLKLGVGVLVTPGMLTDTEWEKAANPQTGGPENG